DKKPQPKFDRTIWTEHLAKQLRWGRRDLRHRAGTANGVAGAPFSSIAIAPVFSGFATCALFSAPLPDPQNFALLSPASWLQRNTNASS
ncbi:MAG TPA: hypothetical protein PK971_13170, partial [Saprospiraceae bacterium]|nr:hypothetical protein [Saprospiraceae bacterium]